ncbi:MAG: DUF4279 domain-containing protein [Planctomycetota bacterium]
MAGKFYIEFSFRGDDFSPEEITTSLGITPSRTWKKGDRRTPKNANTKVVCKNNGWVIRTEEKTDENNNMEEQIELLLARLTPLAYKIKEICSNNKKIEAIFCCVLYAIEANPQVYFKSMIVRQISDMGASIWFDVYNFGDDIPNSK